MVLSPPSSSRSWCCRRVIEYIISEKSAARLRISNIPYRGRSEPKYSASKHWLWLQLRYFHSIFRDLVLFIHFLYILSRSFFIWIVLTKIMNFIILISSNKYLHKFLNHIIYRRVFLHFRKSFSAIWTYSRKHIRSRKFTQYFFTNVRFLDPI